MCHSKVILYRCTSSRFKFIQYLSVSIALYLLGPHTANPSMSCSTRDIHLITFTAVEDLTWRTLFSFSKVELQHLRL